MKYINSQDHKYCINLYNINYFYVKELSVYANFGKKEILLGTFNTKEDAQSEYNNIINIMNEPILGKKAVYQVNLESYWITQRMENEVSEIFRQEADYVTQDYDYMQLDDPDDYIIMEKEEDLERNNITNDDDYDSSDSVDKG